MQVTVDRNEMIQKIAKELKEYDADHKKAVIKYKETLKEYYEYIDRVIQKGSVDRVEMAPHPPTSKREQFEEHISVLQAHTKGEVVMEDHEYTEMLKGIEHLKLSMRNESINYASVATGFASKVVS